MIVINAKETHEMADAENKVPVFRPSTPSTAKVKKVSTSLIDWFATAVAWLAANVIPIIALFIVLGCAVQGAKADLDNKNFSNTQQVVGAIVVIGSFTALAFGSNKKPQ